MYIIRPEHIMTTPRKIAEELHCQTRKYPPKRHRTFSYTKDFFMAPVNPEDVEDAPDEFYNIAGIFHENKLKQRRELFNRGLPVPWATGDRTEAAWTTAGGGDQKFVVRPLRHSGGRGYKLTNNPLDFIQGKEYLSVLYPKKREYRIIYCLGSPLVFIRKKPEVTDNTLAWGANNSSFQTINDVAGSRLSQTDVIQRLSETDIAKYMHIVAFDILLNLEYNPKYVILEANLCPGLEIDGNRAKIVERIKQRNQNGAI